MPVIYKKGTEYYVTICLTPFVTICSLDKDGLKI